MRAFHQINNTRVFMTGRNCQAFTPAGVELKTVKTKEFQEANMVLNPLDAPDLIPTGCSTRVAHMGDAVLRDRLE